MFDQIPLSLFSRKSLKFQTHLKLFKILPNCVNTANNFIFFWNTGPFPKTNLMVFDQAFHGAFSTPAKLLYPSFENLYKDNYFSAEPNTVQS